MYEYIHIFSKLNITKVLNVLKLRISFAFSRIIKQPVIWGLPDSLSIEPTTQCNLRCPECPSGQRFFLRPTGMMDFSLYQKIIDQSHSHLIYLLLYFQGEPFLHPAFFGMVEYASAKRIFTATSTNGHFLSEKNAERTVKSGLDKLIISLDGTTQETYEKYRKGGRIDIVINGIQNLTQARILYKSKTPIIVLQFIVFKHNQHQIDEFKKLAKSLGVDKYEIKTAQIYDYHAGSELIPDIAEYARYTKIDEGYKIKSNLPNYCSRMWHSSVITQNGALVPCCFDKQAEHSFGYVNQQFNVSKAFYSDDAKAFRTKLFSDRKSIDICRNCSEGLK